jgi:two-component system LytT family response regulator
MPRIRTVIVDDEPLAREKLRGFLERHPGFELVGEAADGLEAVKTIDALRPDLVLLDIQMPELDGLEVLAALESEPMPHVVFVTAYDHYAVKAFDQGALDYLLKPVAPDRFDLAMHRVEAELRDGDPAVVAERLRETLDALAAERPRVERFLVKEQERSRFLPVAEVEWIEAAGNYLKLHTKAGIHLIRGTMKQLQDRLDPARFARIHRTTIVNLDRIKYFEPWSHGDQLVVLESGARLTLSRRFRDQLPRTFGSGAGAE